MYWIEGGCGLDLEHQENTEKPERDEDERSQQKFMFRIL